MKNFALLFLAASMLFACKKDKEKNPNIFSLDDFFEKNMPKEQVFTFSADTGYWKTVAGEKGAVLEFNSSPLSGGVSGNITMKLTEVYSKSDAVLSGLHTVDNNGNPLKSAGMMRVTFETGSGQRTAPVGNMKITVPAGNNYYQGSDFYLLAPDSIAGNNFTWSNSASTASIDDSCTGACSAVIYFYTPGIMVDYQWINCDQLLAPPYESVNVLINGPASLKFRSANFILKDYMAIVTVLSYAYSGAIVHYGVMPAGEPLTFMAIAEDDEGVIYWCKKDFVTSDNISVEVTMNPITEEELLAAIRALD